MRILLIAKEPEMIAAAEEAYHATDSLEVYGDWRQALENVNGAEMIIVDLISTLDQPNEVSGYEQFAMAKMGSEHAKSVPLVLISPPDDYELDAMVGWPDFVFGMVKRPVTMKIFRRISTWI